MSHISDYIIKFDLILSRHYKTSFSFEEIILILIKVTKDVKIQKECLDFFVKNNILQKNESNYYYLLEKIYPYQNYKNYLKLKSIIDIDLNSKLNFSKFNI